MKAWYLDMLETVLLRMLLLKTALEAAVRMIVQKISATVPEMEAMKVTEATDTRTAVKMEMRISALIQANKVCASTAAS